MAAGGTAAMAVEAASAGATAEAPSSWVVVMAAGWAALAGVAVGGVVDELAEEMGAAGVQAVVVAGLMAEAALVEAREVAMAVGGEEAWVRAAMEMAAEAAAMVVAMERAAVVVAMVSSAAGAAVGTAVESWAVAAAAAAAGSEAEAARMACRRRVWAPR